MGIYLLKWLISTFSVSIVTVRKSVKKWPGSLWTVIIKVRIIPPITPDKHDIDAVEGRRGDNVFRFNSTRMQRKHAEVGTCVDITP